MAEIQTPFPYEHRQSLTTIIGTQSGTILGAVPPQMEYEITQIVVVPYGTTGGPAVVGALMQFATLQGYSQYGTSQGTIVEPFSAAPGNAPFIDGNGAAPIAYVNSGNLLYGQVAVPQPGSCAVKIVYRPVNLRGW